MRPAAITAVILLLALVYIQDAAAVSADKIRTICNSKYPAQPCSDDWYRIDDDRCAKYFWTEKKFQEAEDYCVSLNGHLVSMHNEDEYSNVLCLALRANRNRKVFWIGGRGRGPTFDYSWTDGTSFDFTRWYPWQPDGHLFEKCVEMNYADWGRWNNALCGIRRYFVCAKKV